MSKKSGVLELWNHLMKFSSNGDGTIIAARDKNSWKRRMILVILLWVNSKKNITDSIQARFFFTFFSMVTHAGSNGDFWGKK